MKTPFNRLPLVAALALLAGCASVSRREGADQVEQLLQQRLPTAFQWQHDAQGKAAVDARVDELLAQPLTPARAFQLAQLRNPQIAARYAELGIAQADVVEASRIANPTFSASSMNDGSPSKISTGLSAPLSDLLLLPSRKRFAEGEYERAQLTIAGALLDLSAAAAADWYRAAAADQVAQLRDAVATAAAASAELAQRFHRAGNISALELTLEQAAASQARIAAASARSEAARARLALNLRMGLNGTQATQWQFDLPLELPPAQDEALDELRALAHERRLDLAAARRQTELLADALSLARRWRLLGSVEVGVEREKESDGSRLHGPTLSLALPLFNQGQAAIARAQAQLERSRADLAALELSIDAEVAASIEQLATLRRIAEDYRQSLLPQREAVVQRQLERHNFMLIGAFELLLAKQQEFDAYQSYLETVRDYWLARVELARVAGSALPSDAAPRGRTPDARELLPAQPAADPHADHGKATTAADPHAGHGSAATAADPHAGHRKAAPATVSDTGSTPQDAHSGHDLGKPAATPPDPHQGHTPASRDAKSAPHDTHQGHGSGTHDTRDTQDKPADTHDEHQEHQP